ncbi:hypothetical protein QSV37_17665 [Acinetobacter sp. VNK23]|uniref:hypothetical protein n=1 Tax=Acinetobacter thutiue TaxID=2998078 RepID=UPI0025791668|nr:hypothetical protein [Acinetobacter thutiue]MDM1022103.1 hypothetical protein [Acinetobacter thutiue]
MNIAVTRPIIATTYGRWWRSEVNVLESMLSEHKPLGEIADVLDCSIERVRKRVELFRCKGGRPKHKFRRTRGTWWECEITVLKKMLQEKFKVPYIAEVLDRDTNCVHTKIQYLKFKGEL